MDKTLNITWDRLHRDSQALAWRLNELPPFTALICIARGGLVPASIIAKELDIRNIEAISISSYDHNKQMTPKVLKDVAEYFLYTPNLLVIDDLVDTGQTVKLIRKRFPHAHIATVYAKPLGQPLINSYLTEVSQDTWITFPWE